MTHKTLAKGMKGKATHVFLYTGGKKVPTFTMAVHFDVDEQAINAALDLSKYDKSISGKFTDLCVTKHTGRYNNGKEVLADIYKVAL